MANKIPNIGYRTTDNELLAYFAQEKSGRLPLTIHTLRNNNENIYSCRKLDEFLWIFWAIRRQAYL